MLPIVNNNKSWRWLQSAVAVVVLLQLKTGADNKRQEATQLNNNAADTIRVLWNC